MYQLGLLYGLSFQLTLPVPSPTLYGARLLQMNVSFMTALSGTASSIVLKPGHT